jgi:hypothetical protein
MASVANNRFPAIKNWHFFPFRTYYPQALVIAKVIHFNCPACEQPVEAGEQASGHLISCPGCGQEFDSPGPAPKTSPSWLIILCVALLMMSVMVGIPLASRLTALSARARSETAVDRQHRLQSEAQALLLPQCTNAIVGLHRIINQEIALRDPDPNQWSAQVTAEFVNRVGGIERTNVPFAFSSYRSPVDGLEHVTCLVDLAKISQAERDALHAKFGYTNSDSAITSTH